MLWLRDGLEFVLQYLREIVLQLGSTEIVQDLGPFSDFLEKEQLEAIK
jgi:hypothetical protein